MNVAQLNVAMVNYLEPVVYIGCPTDTVFHCISLEKLSQGHPYEFSAVLLRLLGAQDGNRSLNTLFSYQTTGRSLRVSLCLMLFSLPEMSHISAWRVYIHVSRYSSLEIFFYELDRLPFPPVSHCSLSFYCSSCIVFKGSAYCMFL